MLLIIRSEKTQLWICACNFFHKVWKVGLVGLKKVIEFKYSWDQRQSYNPLPSHCANVLILWLFLFLAQKQNTSVFELELLD